MSTRVQEILGPYDGKRIAKASDNLVNVTVSRRYVYNEYVIFVKDIHALMDRESGRVYIPGPLALQLNHEVEGIMASLRAKDSEGEEQASQSLFKNIPLFIEKNTPEKHAA